LTADLWSVASNVCPDTQQMQTATDTASNVCPDTQQMQTATDTLPDNKGCL